MNNLNKDIDIKDKIFKLVEEISTRRKKERNKRSYFQRHSIFFFSFFVILYFLVSDQEIANFIYFLGTYTLCDLIYVHLYLGVIKKNESPFLRKILDLKNYKTSDIEEEVLELFSSLSNESQTALNESSYDLLKRKI